MLPKFIEKQVSFFIAPKHATFWGVVENIFLTAFMLLLASATRTEDPLFFTGFRWTFLLPIIFALRYGSIIGAFSMLNLFFSWLIFRWLGYYPDIEFPEGPFIGGLVVTMVAGEFADFWRGKLLKAEGEAVYILEKLESLTKRHVLLRLSHDRLEENLLTRPYTVREALLRLREVASKQPPGTVLPGAHQVLDLLADYCQVKRAAIYAIDNGVLITKPIASIGEVNAIQEGDELLQYSLDYQRLAHVQMDKGNQQGAYLGPYLVCAPIANSNGKVVGMLTVEQLPFLSINYENLQLLSVLLGLYADIVYNREAVQQLRQQWPTMSYMFAQEVIALSYLQMSAEVETSLVILKADGSERAEQLIRAIVEKRRNLDVFWYMEQQPSQLMLLLPMTGMASFSSLEQYWQQQVQELFDVDNLNQTGVKYAQRLLTAEPVLEQIYRMQQVINEQ